MLRGLLVDLIPQGEAHHALALGWVNGPMGEWWGMDGLQTKAAHQRHLESLQSEDRDSNTQSMYSLRTKDGVLIGTFGLFNINYHSRTAEVGAGIGDPDYWAGGFGSDAMVAIVDYGFRWLDLRRLWLNTMGNNVRAQRQVEKCGFTREGAKRSCVRTGRGEYVDFVNYGLLREEWPGREVMIERLGLRARAEARGYAADA